MNEFLFNVRYARRIPDPVFDSLKRHVFVVPVQELPEGLPTDPNARPQNTRTQVARKIRDSLFDRDCESGTFHLKNNGITIIADRVKKNLHNDDLYKIEIADGQGIIDGGHTYRIIIEALEEEELPEEQYVTVEVLTGINKNWIPDISGGRNTSVQVQPISLDNLAGKFDWMKDELKEKTYFREIAWRENDDGEFNARDLVALLCLFNVDLHSNDGETHPLFAYSQKAQALKRFENNPDSFEKMRNILDDILFLHDTVRCNYSSIWNNHNGGRPGRLSFSEKKRNGEWDFIFTGENSEYRMVNGALYPILGAFRWFVEKDPESGLMHWRNGFQDVLKVWEKCALSMLKATHDMSKSLGNKPNAIGKSSPHWSNLHNLVAKRDLERKRP